MNEFVEKLIEKIENEAFAVQLEKGIKEPSTLDAMLEKFSVFRIKEIVNQLAEEYNNSNDSMENQITKNYAKWLTKCGVNVTEKWLTATRQEYALNEAYMRGMQDERDKFARWQDEHKGGWIPCSEKKPRMIDAVLVCEKDGFMTVAIRGQAGKFCDTYANVLDDVIAWMPLPEPFKPKGE